ncbi:hypothetical protein [Pseudarthrobacter sp. IC2-21]|uniref:hypothetical protein n=1 Tax=Pseudarthrobacter sp. IC2-21 TaxID=3092262 RepID=UPI002A6AEA14|nr:hypothetical protein [Pseudarthrobacter sp. IC2-21]
MLSIRQARSTDTPSLIRLRAAWVAELMGESTEDPDFDNNYRTWEANNARTMFVADLDGTPIGMLNLMVFERMPKPGKKTIVLGLSRERIRRGGSPQRRGR